MEYSLSTLTQNSKANNLKTSEIINQLNLIGFEVDSIFTEKSIENLFLDNIRLLIKIPANREDLLNERFFLNELSTILLFNLNNLLRIYESLNDRNDHKFKNFPWYNVNENFNYNTVYLEGNYSFVISKNKDDFCWNSPTPCSLYRNVTFNKKFIYTIISKSD